MPEPTLLRHLDPLRIVGPATRREHHARHPDLLGMGFVRTREHARVTRYQPGRLAEARLVRRQAWGRVGRIGPGWVEPPPAADDPAIDFLQPQLVSELDRLADLVADDDLRVRLEQAEDLVRAGHRLTLEDAALRLGERTLQAWQERLELSREPLGGHIAPAPQHRADPCSLSPGL